MEKLKDRAALFSTTRFVVYGMTIFAQRVTTALVRCTVAQLRVVRK